MKTRQNHRKTTTGRSRRHVKHRVQTRINHRKGTVSSGRRHKFFKRGGQFGTYRDGNSTNSVHTASLSQINIDKEEAAAKAAAKAAAEAAKPIEQNYPDVDAFVNKINAVNVSGFFDSECNLTIQKLPQISFSDSSVQGGEKQSPVIKTINQKTVKFYITFNGCNIDIYVDGTRYGRVVPVTGNNVIDTESMCSTHLINAIKSSLIAASAT
jgi:hypothetical protein